MHTQTHACTETETINRAEMGREGGSEGTPTADLRREARSSDHSWNSGFVERLICHVLRWLLLESAVFGCTAHHRTTSTASDSRTFSSTAADSGTLGPAASNSGTLASTLIVAPVSAPRTDAHSFRAHSDPVVRTSLARSSSPETTDRFRIVCRPPPPHCR